MKFHCISWLRYDILIMGKKEAGDKILRFCFIYFGSRSRAFFVAVSEADMRTKIKKNKRCRGCVWNNRRICGRDFCILPRCIYKPQENKAIRSPDKRGCASIDIH